MNGPLGAAFVPGRAGALLVASDVFAKVVAVDSVFDVLQNLGSFGVKSRPAGIGVPAVLVAVRWHVTGTADVRTQYCDSFCVALEDGTAFL